MLKVLLAVDGSELSLDAVRHGLGLVKQGLQAEFVLGNVQEPASLYEIVVVRDPQGLDDVSAGAGAHQLEAAQALCRSAGVAFESEVVTGDPAHALIDIAERYGCEAIILGARGHGGLRGALLGSVSQGVTQAATVPVTVVKHVAADVTPQDDTEAEADTAAG